jgi:transposase
MVSLVKKIKNGNPYWYLVRSALVNGKPRIVWQKYLGTPDRILELLEGPMVEKLHTLPIGTLGALLDANADLGFVDSIDRHVEKKATTGLTVGQYMLMFILGRTEEHRLSKSGIDSWVDESYLPFIWKIPAKIPCQTYLDQMDYINDSVIESVFIDMCKALMSKGVSMKKLVFDTSNVATNIEKGEALPQTGPSKEKRFDKNLLAFGIAINEDNIPIFSEMHAGNENDADVFSEVVEKLTKRVESLNLPVKDMVLAFDRGMNSKDNIDKLVNKIHIIGGVKRNQLGDLWNIPMSKFSELYMTSTEHKVLGYETKGEVFGRTFRIIMTYNEATAHRQKEQYLREKEAFLKEVAGIQKSLTGKQRGRKPTQQSIARRLTKKIHSGRESIFKFRLGATLESKSALTVWIDKDAEEKLFSSHGKQGIFTDIIDCIGWRIVDVVKAYNGKAMIEDDFKFLKDRLLVSIMPEWHRKDSRIKVHIFLCLVGLTMYRYLLWKLRDTGMSVYQLDSALRGIRIGFMAMKDKERKVQQIMEEMKPEAARIFSKLDVGRFIKE